jgi:hypothetical protein
MNFYYQQNELDSLIFKPNKTISGLGFELFTKGESTSEIKIGNYINNSWLFDDELQRNLFFKLMFMDRKGFQKAFKAFWKAMEEPNNYVVLHCAKRRMTINFTKNYRKTKLKFSSWFYGLYPSNRHF